MDKMERKLRERAANLRGSAFNTNAQLRYMSGDFAGTVFQSENGGLWYTADNSSENLDNEGSISGATIKPYKSPGGDVLAEIRVFAGPKDHYPEELRTATKSEVCEDTDDARQWLKEQGLPLDNLPSETIENYKHPEGADPITVDCGDGEIFTCYVIEERDDRWILAKPNRPTNPYYALDVGSSPVELVWLPNEEKQYTVRNFYRNSH